MIIDKLKRSLIYIDLISPPIIQFGPIRTGSTLVYNVLKEVFPKKRIYKRHQFVESPSKKAKVVITYRNPIDCLASSIKRFKAEPNEKNIKHHLDVIKKNGFDDLLSIIEKQEFLKLKYEDFYNNFDYIYNHLEKFFNVEISINMRNKLNSEFNTEQVIQKTANFDTFSEFDKKNFFHGNHISETKGIPNAYLKFFSESQIKLIEKELHPILSKLGYSSSNFML